MDKTFAVMKAGNQARLARLLGVTPQAVSMWGDKLPELQAYRLKEMRPRWFAEWNRARAKEQEAA